MVGKGDRWKTWEHPSRRYAVGDERIQRWCQSSKQKIRPETIERYQQCRGCKSRGTVGPELWPAWLEAGRRIYVPYCQEGYQKQEEH